MAISSDPHVPPGGSIAADGTLLDANGRPILGGDGKPIVVDRSGSSIAADGSVLDASGLPVLGSDGAPIRVPRGGSIAPDGTVLDASGKPVVGKVCQDWIQQRARAFFDGLPC